MERTDGKNSKLIQFSNRVKPARLQGFWWTKRTDPRKISSQPRYDHFDTAARGGGCSPAWCRTKIPHFPPLVNSLFCPSHQTGAYRQPASTTYPGKADDTVRSPPKGNSAMMIRLAPFCRPTCPPSAQGHVSVPVIPPRFQNFFLPFVCNSPNHFRTFLHFLCTLTLMPR